MMDNGTQFNNLKIEGFYEMYGITVNYSLVYHPQANGMAKAMNKAIEVLNAIHSMVYRNHSEGRTLAYKAITASHF